MKFIKLTTKHTFLTFLPPLIIGILIVIIFGFFWFDRFKSKESVIESNKAEDITKQLEIDKTYTTNEVIEKNSKYIVFIYCNTNDGDVFASGVVIGRDKNNDLLVLTNNHVIENLKINANGIPSCGIRVEGEKGVAGNEYYYVQPAYYPEFISTNDMEIIDFALLTVKDNPRIKSLEIAEDGTRTEIDMPSTFLTLDNYPEICTSEQLKIGEDLIILGFPSISGVEIQGIGSSAKFTATEGIISEKVNYSGYYFNTSAKIEYGNSGSGVFLKNSGCFAGVPTFVLVGEIESIGRILNAYKLQSEFLNNIISTRKNIFEKLINK